MRSSLAPLPSPVFVTLLAALLVACATPEEAVDWADGRVDGTADGMPDDMHEGIDADPRHDLAVEVPPDAAPAGDLGFNGGTDLDAGLDADVTHDAAPTRDAQLDADAPDASWGPCAVDGMPGRCVDVTVCAASGGHATPGHCPGPAAIQCCTEAPPAGFDCDPAEHPTPNAGLVEAAGEGGCPDGMAPVDDFCVDRYEASLVEVMPGGAERPWSPYHNPGATPVRAVSVAGAVPQGYIDGVRAARACEAAGKRLCTDAEWLRACQWTDARTYPYGPARRPGVCNDARAQHPAVELFPDAPNPFALIQDACINQLPASLARAGEHAACVTPEGIVDLMGNLHEWTADPEGTFRGGFYVDTVRNGNGCLYRTTAHDRGHWDYSTGFRCCADR